MTSTSAGRRLACEATWCTYVGGLALGGHRMGGGLDAVAEMTPDSIKCILVARPCVGRSRSRRSHLYSILMRCGHSIKETRFSAGDTAVYVTPNKVMEFTAAVAGLLDDPERC